ncbi:hypothetical protein QN277_003614 [Acacia crassicarpa]|uniref:TF-B3 domain-containing protein n=1 Tax=Acacia crassicarpa TaxID=499986 RepID=A0AAE1MCQ1_9FABA|nr:hypothetical protein QN277_003614 [Acacia crassicarpa]
MKPSHLCRGFGLGLPKRFCKEHLPKADTMIVLEDENGREYEIKYLAERLCLSSGGWKNFSKKHNLIVGDVLIFHLIQPSKFKVYIKSHGSNKMDAAHRVDGSLNQLDSGVVPRENDLNNNGIICDANMPASDQPENRGDPEEHLGLEVLNENRLERSTTTFQEVTGMDNFTIVANGLVPDDSQLPQHIKTKYYELCCSQKMFLHEHLLGGQNHQLVFGMIYELINIAHAIKASKITTPTNSFDVWHRKLKGLEMWGMNVNFLLTRLEQLRSLASKTEEYKEARNNREQAEEQKKDLELKLEIVKENIERLDGQIDSKNLNLQTLGAEFQGLANASW